MGMDSPPPKVKAEPVDPIDTLDAASSVNPDASAQGKSEQRLNVERRFESVVRWGARSQEVKRRKVRRSFAPHCG